MDQISLNGKARRLARCGASGKRRYTAGRLNWSAEGRVVLRIGGVARPIRYPASHCEAGLAKHQQNSVKAAPNWLKGL